MLGVTKIFLDLILRPPVRTIFRIMLVRKILSSINVMHLIDIIDIELTMQGLAIMLRARQE